MWLLEFIPDWMIHLSLILGIVVITVSMLLGSVPFISKYKNPLLALGILILCGGLFFEGMLYCNSKWETRTLKLEKELAAAQLKSSEENVKIITKYVTKTVKVKEKAKENIKYVKEYVTKYDNRCDVPNAAIVLHNSASQNKLPPSPGPAYEGTSEVKISQFTETVVENYGTYYELVEQVKAWQEWYRTNKEIFNKANDIKE